MKFKNIAIVLFVLAVLLGQAVFAQDSNDTNNTNDTNNSNDTNNPIPDANDPVIDDNAPVIPPTDQNEPVNRPVQRRGFSFVGLGVAVNQSDNTDFESVRIQVQHIGKILAANAVDKNADITGKGLIFFGTDKFRLGGVTVLGEDQNLIVNANILGLKDKNSAILGTVFLTKVKDKENSKAVGIVKGYWKGTITLNGKTFDAYIPTAFSKRISLASKLEKAREKIEEIRENAQKKVERIKEQLEKKRLEVLRGKSDRNSDSDD